MTDKTSSIPDEWTLERALNVARKHREWWPDGPQTPDGRVPGVGYFVSTILADRIAELEAQVKLLERHPHVEAWRIADERAEAARRTTNVLADLVRDAEERFLQIMEPEEDVRSWLTRVEVARAIGVPIP